jgi:hypothetical protein
MDENALFKVLKRQTKATLLDLLRVTYQETSSQQQRYIFGDLMKKPKPLKAVGQEILKESQNFYRDSLAGVYYAPFDINSKNFFYIPEETEEWFEKLGDLLQSSAQLTKQPEHATAVESFKILYELIEKMEHGDEIIFADEYGSWMIPGNEEDFLDAYISSLAEVETAEGYASIVIPLIKRDSHSSFCNKVYSIAVKYSNKEQKKSLAKAIKEQNIRTRSSL